MKAVTSTSTDETSHRHASTAALSWRVRGFVALVIGLVAAGHSIAAPYVVNQNQYFVHAVGQSDPRLSSDWLTGTTDPYPAFSWIMRLIIDLGGQPALRILAYGATVCGLLAVFLIARALSPRRGVGVPLVAAVLVGLTLSVGRLGSLLPLDWSVSAFQGFAGQYILMKPGYVQPTTAGVLILLAFGLLLQGASQPLRRFHVALAVVLVGVAALMAPTNAVIAAMAVGAAFLADAALRRPWRHIGLYVGLIVVAVICAIVGSPSILSLGSTDPMMRQALDRFAFELFPLHTLATHWPPDDSALLIVIAAGVILVPVTLASSWIKRWLLIATAGSLFFASIVVVTHSSTLALLFPWRVSVIIVPIAATMVAVRVAGWLSPLAVGHWHAKLVFFAAIIAVPGLASTAAKASPTSSESMVSAVAAARPSGVGLIPLSAGTVRLNARVPVYVDAMSPPYAGRDLREFWNRVDRVRRFEANPESFCSAEWTSDIDWIEMPTSVSLPSCLSTWRSIGPPGEWRILQRP
jgi:hypothetical protein